MTDLEKADLIQDFKGWSGGTAPNGCTQEEIQSYIDNEMPPRFIHGYQEITIAEDVLWEEHARQRKGGTCQKDNPSSS